MTEEITFMDVEDELELKLQSLNGTDVGELNQLNEILSNPRQDEVALKVKEKCLYSISRLYSSSGEYEKVTLLIESNSDFFSIVPKSKAAKIIRTILGIIASSSENLDLQIEFCYKVIQWCQLEKRTFLRQRIEAKLSTLLLQKKEPSKALTLVESLLKELKKLDDKHMLTEVHLTESRIYHSLRNIPKSKSSLTASRTAANSIYVVPILQAEIDEMSGTLHCEEGDYTTAYSYFLEAYDAYDQSQSQARALSCLHYMILCKILNEASQEVHSLLASKMGLKYAGKSLQIMADIATAANKRSLEDFKKIVGENSDFLQADDLIAHHLDVLYDKMLEINLLKIIHPFSCVEISHVARLIKQSEDQVVRKLSQMILDHKFHGILDQGKGHLIIYDSSTEDHSFSKGGEIVQNLGNVVDVLFARSRNLSKVNAV